MQAQYPNAVPTTPAAYPPQAQTDPYGQQAPYGQPGYTDTGSGLYAGVAYEVHTLGSGGTSTPVDVASYSFATGERFIVYYRPTLPGVINVFNVNPLGQEKQIDAVNVAAGQLATLGPL